MKRNINLRIMAVTVALVLIATLGAYLPGTQVFAETITEPLDFTLDQADEKYPGTAGDGWAWNAESKNLTLDCVWQA